MSDLISKKELYRKLGEAYNHCLITWGENEIIKDIIGECDPVENKGEDRPKGKWIYWSGSPFRWECDKCGGLFKTDFNFCPNCGANMRGET